MKLAWDSNQFKVTINHVDIYISPENLSPFAVMAIVEEQDTSLVLQPDDEIHESIDDKPLWYDSNKAELLETYQTGDVIIKSFNPMRFLAIVHDLDQTPSWQSEWIEMALDKILAISNTKELSAICLPLLGTQYGRFKLDEFMLIFGRVLNKNKVHNLKRIWLVMPATDCQLAFNLLDKV